MTQLIPVAYEIFRLLNNNLLIERLERLLEKNYDVSERIENKTIIYVTVLLWERGKEKVFIADCY